MIKSYRFKKYYQAHQEFVRVTIYWMVRSEVANDLVQETFIKAWKNFDNFNHKSSFKTWIYRIAMNTTYDYLRGVKESTTEVEMTSDSFEDGLELKDLLDYALSQIDLNSREVFVLYFKLEYSIKEIGEILGIPEGTVKSRLFKAREKIGQILKENGVDHA